MRNKDSLIKSRIVSALREIGGKRVTRNDISRLFPELTSRQLANALNKLYYDGMLKRWTADGHATGEFITLVELYDKLDNRMEVEVPDNLKAMHAAFGMPVSTSVALQPYSATSPRVIKRDNTILHRTMLMPDTEEESAD